MQFKYGERISEELSDIIRKNVSLMGKEGILIAEANGIAPVTLQRVVARTLPVSQRTEVGVVALLRKSLENAHGKIESAKTDIDRGEWLLEIYSREVLV
jgi:hypothetical protein